MVDDDDDDDDDEDDDDVSGFLLGLATLHAAIGGSWVLDFLQSKGPVDLNIILVF